MSVIGAVVGGILGSSVGVARKKILWLVILSVIGAAVGFFALGFFGIP